MLWSDSAHLTDTKYFAHGSFNYDVRDDIIQPKKHVILTHWKFLFFSVTNLVSFLPYYLP